MAVDLRKSSPTFGKWVSAVLSAENRKQFWIPEGFAHGFLALSEMTELLYKCTSFYSPSNEQCIAWNDPEIGVAWGLDQSPVVSSKDAAGQWLRQAYVFD